MPQSVVAVMFFIETASRVAARVTAIVCVGMTIGLIGSLLLQIAFRYLLNAPLSWTGEVAVFLFVWTVLLLASLGVREGTHVRLSLLVDSLPPALGVVIERLILAAITLFGIFLSSTGVRMVELVWGNTSAAIQYPLQALYIAAPISGALIALHGLARLIGQNEGHTKR